MGKFKFTKSIKSKGVNFHKLNYGAWAMQSITYGTLSNKHILFIKQYLQKRLKRFKQFKFIITKNKITTKKPLDTRMGGGKGSIYDTQCFLKPGSIFLEFYNIPSELMRFIFKEISNKISIKIKLLNIT